MEQELTLGKRVCLLLVKRVMVSEGGLYSGSFPHLENTWYKLNGALALQLTGSCSTPSFTDLYVSIAVPTTCIDSQLLVVFIFFLHFSMRCDKTIEDKTPATTLFSYMQERILNNFFYSATMLTNKYSTLQLTTTYKQQQIKKDQTAGPGINKLLLNLLISTTIPVPK